MTRLYYLCAILSLLVAYQARAAEELERIPLLGEDQIQSEMDFTFRDPKFREEHYFSKTVELDRICKMFKAGPSISSETDYARKRSKYLAVFKDDKWKIEKLVKGSPYIKILYCSNPSREDALEYFQQMLHKSQGGNKVDVVLWNKLARAHPDLVTQNLALDFLIAEQRKRFHKYTWNFNPHFVNKLVQLYPNLEEHMSRTFL